MDDTRYTKKVRVETLEVGDTVIIDGDTTLVLDIRENSRCGGVWVEYGSDPQATGASKFFEYADTIEIVC